MADKTIGRCSARAESGADLFTPEGKTPYVGARFRMLDGEYKDNVYEWRGYLSDAARERTMQALIACGCKPERLNNADVTGIETNVVQATLGESEYGIRVGFIDPAGGRGAPEEDRATGPKKKALAALFKGTLAALRPGAVKAAPAANPFANDDGAGLGSDAPANEQASGEPENDGGERHEQATGTDDGAPRGNGIPF